MDTDDTYEADDSNLVKDLRKQLNDALKAKKQYEEELGQYKTQLRERTVAEVLTAKGVNPKVAKFLPSDVEGDEAINAWLEENSELFGAPAPSEPEPAVSEETRTEMSRASSLAAQSVPAGRTADFEQRIANANSVEELNGILAEYQKFQL